MSRKKLAVPWILFGITAIACIVLVIFIAVQGKETGKQASSQNAEENSSPNFQDYSDYHIVKGYYMRTDGGIPFFLEEDSDRLVKLLTEDELMFSELMNGDVIMLAMDEVILTSFPGRTGAYKCICIEKSTGDRKFLSERQEELEKLAELGYTFEDYWRR